MSDDPRNICACGHRRRDHRIEGLPGAPLEDTRWYECEVCDCEQFDGLDDTAYWRKITQEADERNARIDGLDDTAYWRKITQEADERNARIDG